MHRPLLTFISIGSYWFIQDYFNLKAKPSKQDPHSKNDYTFRFHFHRFSVNDKPFILFDLDLVPVNSSDARIWCWPRIGQHGATRGPNKVQSGSLQNIKATHIGFHLHRESWHQNERKKKRQESQSCFHLIFVRVLRDGWDEFLRPTLVCLLINPIITYGCA